MAGKVGLMTSPTWSGDSAALRTTITNSLDEPSMKTEKMVRFFLVVIVRTKFDRGDREG